LPGNNLAKRPTRLVGTFFGWNAGTLACTAAAPPHLRAGLVATGAL